MLPIHPTDYHMDTRQRKALTASAPAANDIPYWLYKNTPSRPEICLEAKESGMREKKLYLRHG